MERHLVIPDYMVEFACLGAACPNHCCPTYWTLEIDVELYPQLRAAMADNPADRRILEERFPRDAAATPPVYRRIAVVGETDCPFFQSDRLCRIHSAYGEEMLPLVCRVFPRLYRPTGQGLLVYGTLACPEIARLALTAAAEPVLLRLTPADGPGRHRDPSARWRAADEPDPVDREDARILETLLDILAPGRYQLPFALFLAGVFARRIDAGDPVADAADATGDAERLAMLRASYTAAKLVTHTPLQTAWATLGPVARHAETPVGAFVKSALNSYPGVDHASAPTAASPAEDWDAVCSRIATATLAGYLRRRAAIEAACPGRMAGYWQRYSRHFFFSNAPLQAGTLLGHVQRLALHLVMLDVLCQGQPAVRALAGEGGTAPEDPAAALDAALIQTATHFARGTTHSRSLQELVQRHMAGMGAFGVGHLLTLLYLFEDGAAGSDTP